MGCNPKATPADPNRPRHTRCGRAGGQLKAIGMTYETLQHRVHGLVFTKYDPDFESTSDALIWNGRKPLRHATIIVRATSVADVQEAVRYASQNRLRVSPRGGGHQFTGIAAKADMVIDLGGLDGLRIDVEGRTARIEPSVTNLRLSAALDRHGLAFPVGHCGSVTISGYLLGGGVGWNSSEWGIACFSIFAVEVVLANGELVTATEHEHADIFWAARGAGPKFFGIVTAYHVHLQAAPSGSTTVVRVYPTSAVAAVAAWAERIMAQAPSYVEFTAKIAAGPAGPAIAAIANVFAPGEAEAKAVIDLIAEDAPDGAFELAGPMPTPIPMLYEFTDPSTPQGHHYGVDTFWSDADFEAALAPVIEAIAAAPSPKSYAVVSLRPNAKPTPKDAAFSRFGRIIGIIYGVWEDEDGDAANLAWLRAGMDGCRSIATGSYVGEADLDRPGGPLPTHSPDALARLAELAARHDPTGLFTGHTASRLAAE